MKKRIIYDDKFYSTLLKEETINISKNFNTSEFWGDKVNEGVLIAYDFIPVNKKLKVLEMNTNVGIFKEYIPYFDFNGFSSFCKKNKYKKVISVVNTYWFNRRFEKFNTPSIDFLNILENKLKIIGIEFELFSTPSYPSSIPEFERDDNTFILRFSFDIESEIDKLAENKQMFNDWICSSQMDYLLPNKYNGFKNNDLFPDAVIKDFKLDNQMGVRFISGDKIENTHTFLSDDEYIENFIVSDKLDGIEEYNVELRSLALVTSEEVLYLNSEPFFSFKKYDKNNDIEFNQINAHGTNFIEDTDVLMVGGQIKKIQDINVGDKILSYDIEELKKNKSWREWYNLNFNDLDSIRMTPSFVRGVVFKKVFGYVLINNTIKLTKNASVICETSYREWKFIRSDNIKRGDVLLLNNQQTLLVNSIKILDDTVNSFGIEVENYDNYFGDNLFTHNISIGAFCFIAGTKITMVDGSEKNIENVEVGNVIKSWNEELNEIGSSKVVKLIQPVHDDIVKLTFDGVENKNTFDHPYYIKNKGWCSYKPNLTMDRYDIGQIGQLSAGDICYKYTDNKLMEIKLKSIDEELDEVQTYIFELDNNNTFFANNILVHNKDGSTTYGYSMAGRLGSSQKNNLQYMNVMTTSGGASDKGDDIASRQSPSGGNSHQYMFNMGGYPSPKNWISYFADDTTTGNASDKGDLSLGRQASCGGQEGPDTEGKFGGDPYIYCAGGQNGGKRNTIDYHSGTTTSGNASDVGDLTQSVSFCGGVNGDVYTYRYGGNTSCFLPDQLINMSDGTYKKISDIELCDKILVWDEENKKVVKNIVNEIHIKLHDDVYELHLENGKILNPTGNHPFWTKDKKWTTIDGYKLNHAGGSGFLEVGDHVKDIKDGWIKVVNIIPTTGKHATYNFIDMKNGTIIADDIVTHNSVTDVIDYWSSTSTSTNATDKGDLIAALKGMAGNGASGHDGSKYLGFASGGVDSGGARVNYISYIDTATTTGGATDRGDLSAQMGNGAGCSGDDYCFYMGGTTSSNTNGIDNIDYWDISTTSGNASDKGNLNESMKNAGGAAGYSQLT